MSTFEKIIIPLLDINVKTIDFTSLTGFVDSFTLDPDRPSGEKEFFLVFDDSVRNEYVEDLKRRLDFSTKIKRSYIKYVNTKPYLVYSFYIPSEVKKFYNSYILLSASQISKILQFWGVFDSDVNSVVEQNGVMLDDKHKMPLEDYRTPLFSKYKSGLVIKKGSLE